jgi:hypothetical protein
VVLVLVSCNKPLTNVILFPAVVGFQVLLQHPLINAQVNKKVILLQAEEPSCGTGWGQKSSLGQFYNYFENLSTPL